MSNLKFIIALLTVVVLHGLPSLRAQSLQFVEEVIDVHVLGDYCTLTGTYTFKNHAASEAAWSIFYPLLNTEQLPFADSICVLNILNKNRIPFATSEKGISFPANIPPSSTSTYRVFYRQQTPARKMEYILTTTKHWGRPLERATFIITIPDSLQLTGMSIPYDRIEKVRNKHIYHIHKTNFLPEENLVISWRRKKS